MSIEHEKPLTIKQEKFLAQLLQGTAINQAAAVTGVSERTGYTWAELPAIRRALHEAARVSTYTALRALQWAAPAAVETLAAQLEATQPSGVKVQAASKILDLVIQLAKMDQLANRLDALEALVEAQQADTSTSSLPSSRLPHGRSALPYGPPRPR